MRSKRGFTVVEILVVLAIVSILAGAVIFNAVSASKRSRDVDRQADLRLLQSAVELYKQRYGRYPAGCNGPGAWSGQLGTTHACTDGSAQYIVGHQSGISFAPAFIPSLPNDRRLPDTDAGYVYKVNTDGTVYKIAARRTVESETVTYAHSFKNCDANNTASTLPVCNEVAPSNNKPNHCQESDAAFRTTYAVWGGYASGGDAQAVEQGTEDIICD